MNLSRRQFMAASAAISFTGTSIARASTTNSLKAGKTSIQLAPPDYPKTELWGFNGQATGPEIRLKQGARLTRLFENGLTETSSLHWHGIRVPNEMDGVPGVTQDVVQAGGSFLYDFTVPDAGTYWYHSHQNTVEQLARGLYGTIVVEEPDAPDIDREETIVLDDWRLTQKAEIHTDFENPHDFSHAGRLGNFVTSNNNYDLNLKVRRNERLRLRLINSSNSRIFDLALVGLDGWMMALDGMPLAAPESIEQFTLAPAQRMDLFVDVTAEIGESAYLVRVDRGEPFAQATFGVKGAASDMRREPPKALPPNPVAALAPIASARKAPLLMEGGAMGVMRSARLNGAEENMRTLAQAGMYWAFNGTVGLPEEPLIEASASETIRVPITNHTVFPHAMHLHGHHFREVRPDGGTGPLRDTILLYPDETREIAFVADNPGDWVFHCHMLAHVTAGMITWIKVS